MDEKFISQETKVFTWFQNNVGTMKQCSIELGIDRANICRYASHFRQSNVLRFHHTGIDEVTGHKSGFFYIPKEFVYNSRM